MPPKRERSESVESSTLADVELIAVAPVNIHHHHAFNELMSNSQEGVAFLHKPRFSNAMKDAAFTTNATVTFNVTSGQAVEELRRFLALKVFLYDDKAEKLAPSSLMETMWHAAILDTQLHQELQAVLPFFIHHRPASDAEAEARKARLITMESVYHRFFGRNPLGAPRENPVPLADNRPRKKPRHVSRHVRRHSLPVVHRPITFIELSDGEDEFSYISERRVAHHVPQHAPRYVAVKGDEDDDEDKVYMAMEKMLKEEENEVIVKYEDGIIELSDDEDDAPRNNGPPVNDIVAKVEDAEPPKFVTLYLDVGYAHPKLRGTMRDTSSFQRAYRQVKSRFFKDKVGPINIHFDGESIDEFDTPRGLGMEDGDTLFVEVEEWF